MFYSTQI